jgi:hypothetical protein
VAYLKYPFCRWRGPHHCRLASGGCKQDLLALARRRQPRGKPPVSKIEHGNFETKNLCH